MVTQLLWARDVFFDLPILNFQALNQALGVTGRKTSFFFLIFFLMRVLGDRVQGNPERD